MNYYSSSLSFLDQNRLQCVFLILMCTKTNQLTDSVWEHRASKPDTENRCRWNTMIDATLKLDDRVILEDGEMIM
jgi:hypothetical protein